MISPTYAGQKALSSKNLATLLGRFLLTIFYLSIDKMQYIFKYVNNFLKKINKKKQGKSKSVITGEWLKSYVMLNLIQHLLYKKILWTSQRMTKIKRKFLRLFLKQILFRISLPCFYMRRIDQAFENLCFCRTMKQLL